MNKQRRQAIETIAQRLQDLHSDLETLKDEEQDSFDNFPEGLQASERGQLMESAVYTLETALDSISEAADTLTEAVEQ